MGTFQGFSNYTDSFNENYKDAYECLERRVGKILDRQTGPLSVLDVGCGDGWMASVLLNAYSDDIFYIGVDPEEASIARLNSIDFSTTHLKAGTIAAKVEDVLEDVSGELNKRFREVAGDEKRRLEFDLILCNATGHQIRKKYVGNDVRDVYRDLADLLSPKGVLVVSDYWYPDRISDREIEFSQFWIRCMTGQTPTDRNGFLALSYVLEGMNSDNLHIREPVDRVKANEEIDLHYYVIEATGQE